MTDPLSELFKHNLWANLHLLDVCQGLDAAQRDHTVIGTYGSIGATWAHLVAAEAGYVALLNEREPDRSYSEGGTFTNWQDLRERVQHSGEDLIAIATGFDGTRMIREVAPEGVYTYPAFVLLLQAINHATEHRIHIAAILTHLGIEPPTLDGWRYNEDVLSTG